MSVATQGPLVILSGPSGSGKSTLIKRLVADGDLRVRLSVSATTRAARPGERDGLEYYFWTREKFLAAVDAGAFLEYAVVHGRDYYGTLRGEVERLRRSGDGVLLDVDLQGARLLRKRVPIDLAVFIRTSTWEVFEERLRARRTETEESLARRLRTAREELAHQDEYDAVVINDDLEAAVRELKRHIAGAFAARAAGANPGGGSGEEQGGDPCSTS